MEVSYNGTAIVNNGTLIIGIDDNIVYNTSPRIIGNTTAIDNNGIINFYDGNIQISAEGNVIKGNDINQIPSGYIVNKEDKKYSLLKN